MLQFKLDPAARRVLGLWLFLPGALVCPFLFWRSFVWGAVFLIGWSVLSLWLCPLWAASFQASVTLGEVRVEYGLLFKIRRRVPSRFVTGVSRMSTPLLHSCGCSLILIHTSGTALWLPGLSNETADQVLDLLGGRL